MINAETTKTGDKFRLTAQIPGYTAGPGDTVEVVGVSVNALSVKDQHGEPAMLSYKVAGKYLELVTDEPETLDAADVAVVDGATVKNRHGRTDTDADTVPPSDEAPAGADTDAGDLGDELEDYAADDDGEGN